MTDFTEKSHDTLLNFTHSSVTLNIQLQPLHEHS